MSLDMATEYSEIVTGMVSDSSEAVTGIVSERDKALRMPLESKLIGHFCFDVIHDV